MNENQRAAYVFSQGVSALAKIAGMVFANLERMRIHRELAYLDSDFNEAVESFGISHNEVIQFLNGGQR